jgi:uncharacterized protein
MSKAKQKIGLVAIVGLLVIVVGAAAWVRYKPQLGPSKAVADLPAHNDRGSKEPEEPLHPLMIEAIRQRQYPGSDIVVEQELGNRGGSRDQIISFKSDGFKVYALASLPNAPAPAGGYPVIMLLHGYIPPAQYQTDGADYKTIIAAWTRAGFAVIKPDFRGHGQSEGVPEGGHYSPVYTYDVLNLMASLKRYQPVNAGRIGLIGHSLGANVALRAAVVSSEVKASAYMAGVVGSAHDLFFNWPRRPDRRDMPTGIVRANLEKLIADEGNPQTNPDFWNKVSAINYVNGLKGPIQIHHGTADDVVPILFSEHLRDAMTKAGKPVEYFAYEGGDHQFTVGNTRALLLERTIDFFRRSL